MKELNLRMKRFLIAGLIRLLQEALDETLTPDLQSLRSHRVTVKYLNIQPIDN